MIELVWGVGLAGLGVGFAIGNITGFTGAELIRKKGRHR